MKKKRINQNKLTAANSICFSERSLPKGYPVPSSCEVKLIFIIPRHQIFLVLNGIYGME